MPVVNGVYSVALNFGAIFGSSPLWLQVNYRAHPASGSPPYTATPTPRPLLSNSPYADYATLSGNTLALQGKGIATTAPATGQVLTYNGTALDAGHARRAPPPTRRAWA